MAIFLNDWLPNVIQTVVPFVSDDIGKGEPWYAAIGEAVETAAMGVVVVTPENQQKPWLNFEAGAISQVIGRKRACPLVLGMTKGDLIAPLGALNATDSASKDDMKRLVLDMVPDNITPTSVAHAFEREWPELEAVVKKLMGEGPPTPEPPRDTDDVLAEILQILRSSQRVAPVAPLEFKPSGGPDALEILTSHLMGDADGVRFTQSKDGITLAVQGALPASDPELRNLLRRVAKATDARKIVVQGDDGSMVLDARTGRLQRTILG